MEKVSQKPIMFIMNLKFFSKIFISICIVSFIGIFSIALAYQHYFKQVLTENESERVQRSIDQASLNLDNRLNNIVSNIYYFFYYSDQGTRLLNRLEQRDKEATLEAFRMQYSSELESVFFLTRDQQDGKETLIHDDNLSIVKELNYRDHRWYQMFLNRETELWSEPTTDHLFYQDKSLSTIYLTLSQYDVDGRDGILVVRLNDKLFSDAFRLLADTDLAIEVRDTGGNIVYASVPRVADDPTGYLPMKSTLNYSGFEVQAFINEKSILEKVYKVRSIQPYIIVLILVMTLAFSLVLSLSMTRPIRKLLLLMKRVELGDLKVRFSAKYSDEVGILGQNFNNMLANLSQLLEQVYDVRMEKIDAEMKQKDATLLALQNQINPHFLYNTLEVINCQAIIHEVPGISRMSKALADFFRYPIDNQQIEVELQTEIEHVKTYLAIQQERYPDIEIVLDNLDPFYAYPIIKLTLQPIVENAFLYAFTGHRDYYLKVFGEEQDGYYIIFIEDNGQGMKDEVMEQLNRLFDSDYESLKGTEVGKGRGIGLLNVHYRIRLRYGQKFGLQIDESITGGVIVRILLPKGVIA